MVPSTEHRRSMFVSKHWPVIWSRAQDSLSERRPAHVENFGQVSGEDLQRLVRAGGQVVDADIFILAACCYHVPAQRRKEHGIKKGLISYIKMILNINMKYICIYQDNYLDKTVVNLICKNKCIDRKQKLNRLFFTN